jgi:hypothetical protein
MSYMLAQLLVVMAKEGLGSEVKGKVDLAEMEGFQCLHRIP